MKDIPQGVWSHDTALDIHELSDVMPSKMHMTVPRNFRRRIEMPKLLFLHYANLGQSEIEERQGYRVTTPYRTIIDIVEAKTIADNFIIQTVNQALKRGLVTVEELKLLRDTHPNIYLKIKRLTHDKF